MKTDSLIKDFKNHEIQDLSVINGGKRIITGTSFTVGGNSYLDYEDADGTQHCDQLVGTQDGSDFSDYYMGLGGF